MTSVHERVAAARARLRSAGIPPEEADLDARLLAQLVLGWDAARFLSAADAEGPPDFPARYAALVARRAAREPLAYIAGRQEFWGLDIEVSPAVLVPRPETELLVEAALDVFPDPDAPVAAADVCTGSGCVAVALACERPGARIVGADVDAAALAVARRNAERHGVGARIELVQSDLLNALAGPFDLVVASPPYLRDGDRPSLQPEILRYEPARALFAGADGLDLVRRLVADAPARLRPGGVLLFEFGAGQADDVALLIARQGDLALGAIRRDLQGIPRAAVARRRAAGRPAPADAADPGGLG